MSIQLHWWQLPVFFVLLGVWALIEAKRREGFGGLNYVFVCVCCWIVAAAFVLGHAL